MSTFIDDDGNVVKAVTAEQHALDNPGHWVNVAALVHADGEFRTLVTECKGTAGMGDCEWWNEEGYK